MSGIDEKLKSLGICQILTVSNVAFIVTCMVAMLFRIPWSWGHYIPFGVWTAVFISGLIALCSDGA